MHADLVKLLELQNKDSAVDDIRPTDGGAQRRVRRPRPGASQARDGLDGARRAAAEGIRRRDELEARVESYRAAPGAAHPSAWNMFEIRRRRRP